MKANLHAQVSTALDKHKRISSLKLMSQLNILRGQNGQNVLKFVALKALNIEQELVFYLMILHLTTVQVKILKLEVVMSFHVQ
jgi:hypothetical protein